MSDGFVWMLFLAPTLIPFFGAFLLIGYGSSAIAANKNEHLYFPLQAELVTPPQWKVKHNCFASDITVQGTFQNSTWVKQFQNTIAPCAVPFPKNHGERIARARETSPHVLAPFFP
jgi:hypothetical protein